MNIKTPCLITARLLPGIKIEGIFISIEYRGRGADGRTNYKVNMDGPSFEYTDYSMSSGVQGADLQTGLISFLNFLAYAGEHARYIRNTGRDDGETPLFPAHVTDWAEAYAEEIGLAAFELEETPGAIEE